MESTVDKLEAKFQKAEAEIDFISRKLDSEFTGSQAGDEKVKANPAQILQKLAEVKQQYAAIVQEAEAIKQAQQEAMNFFKGELTTLCDKLAGVQMLVEPGQSSSEADPGGDASACGGPAAVEDSNAAEAAALPKMATGKQLPSKSKDLPVSPYERRKDSTEVIEIDEAEFASVSSLVRGRAKLSEVNQTYHILWLHFKEDGNTAPLSKSEMFKMGLRVTGQTGEAKLKILRALKLLEISKQGDVKLL